MENVTELFKQRPPTPTPSPKIGVGVKNLKSAAVWPDFVPVICGLHCSTAEGLAYKYVIINYHNIFVFHRQNLW